MAKKYGPQGLARPPGWDSALAAEKAALRHFLNAASNPTVSERPKHRDGEHGPQRVACPPGWDSALAAEKAALRRFYNAASNPTVSDIRPPDI